MCHSFSSHQRLTMMFAYITVLVNEVPSMCNAQMNTEPSSKIATKPIRKQLRPSFFFFLSLYLPLSPFTSFSADVDYLYSRNKFRQGKAKRFPQTCTRKRVKQSNCVAFLSSFNIHFQFEYATQ